MQTNQTLRIRLIKAFKRDKYLHLIFILPLVYFIIFEYVPMYGLIIAFKNLRVFRGFKSILNADWNNFVYFKEFLSDPYFWKLVRNTIMLSLYSIIFVFPAPILLALLLNEVKNKFFKKTIQTITYLPHFISTVVICGMIVSFLASDGLLNQIIMKLGGESVPFLNRYQYFRSIYIVSEIWQGIGWGSIVYLAALNGIDMELYEAAKIDGANRFKQVIHVTIPGIIPTISILLIMQIGKILNIGYQKIILLYNGTTYETADVISTYVYRRGLIDGSFSYATAVNLFSTVINLMFTIFANKIGKALKTTTLW